jgi:LPS-assembly lipoprotein
METPVTRYRFFSCTLLVFCVLALSACGFTLRGSSGNFKLPFKTLHISTGSKDLFGTTLKRQIQGAGSTVVDDRKQAEASLDILERGRLREILSLSTAGRVREYALFYTFRFQVRDRENHILMSPVQNRLRRTMTYDESQAYAKEQEERMLYEEMESDVMLQVIRRLANIQPKKDSSADREPDI